MFSLYILAFYSLLIRDEDHSTFLARASSSTVSSRSTSRDSSSFAALVGSLPQPVRSQTSCSRSSLARAERRSLSRALHRARRLTGDTLSLTYCWNDIHPKAAKQTGKKIDRSNCCIYMSYTNTIQTLRIRRILGRRSQSLWNRLGWRGADTRAARRRSPAWQQSFGAASPPENALWHSEEEWRKANL